MTKIFIPFNQWSNDKLVQEIKTATSRTKKYGKPLDTFSVNFGGNKGIYIYELLTITRKTLQEIAEKHYKKEGCDSPEKFKSVWVSIHPIAGWEPDKKVWFHEFRLIRKLNQTKGCFDKSIYNKGL